MQAHDEFRSQRADWRRERSSYWWRMLRRAALAVYIAEREKTSRLGRAGDPGTGRRSGLLVSLEANLKTTTIGILHYPAPNYFVGDNVLSKSDLTPQASNSTIWLRCRLAASARSSTSSTTVAGLQIRRTRWFISSIIRKGASTTGFWGDVLFPSAEGPLVKSTAT